MSDDVLDKLDEAAKKLAEFQSKHAEMKLELERSENQIKYYTEDILPFLLEEAGQVVGTPFRTRSGLMLTLTEDVITSIADADKEEAFKWLDETGHGGMVKRDVIVRFDREQQEAAQKLLEDLREEFPEARQNCAVHWQTLRAWAREMLEANEFHTIPDSIFHERKNLVKLKRKS